MRTAHIWSLSRAPGLLSAALAAPAAMRTGACSQASRWTQKAILEGHTLWDALLLNACSNIGQVRDNFWQWARQSVLAADLHFERAN